MRLLYVLALCFCFVGCAPVVHRNPGKWQNKSVCDGSSWSEASAADLLEGRARPDVQCQREPQCVRWSWTTFERCKAMQNVGDWPTWDPHVQLTGRERPFSKLVEDFLGNTTFAFVGDSINHQLSVATECEAARLGGWEFEGGGHPAGTVVNAGFRFKARLAALSRYNEEVGRPAGSWWDAPLVAKEGGAIFVHKGFARYNRTDLAALLDVVDFVMYSGATIGEYEADMRLLFAQLSVWVGGAPRSRVALFRETGAQHFAGTGAFASWDQAHPRLGDGCECQPLSPAAAASNVVKSQNEAVQRAAADFPLVGVVPFYELTAPRFDMHEGPFCSFGHASGPQPCCDCTHYCYTPQLWAAWFDDLYAATEAHSARRAAVHSGAAVARAKRRAGEAVGRKRGGGRAGGQPHAPAGEETSPAVHIDAAPPSEPHTLDASPPPAVASAEASAAAPPPPLLPPSPPHRPPLPPLAPHPPPEPSSASDDSLWVNSVDVGYQDFGTRSRNYPPGVNVGAEAMQALSPRTAAVFVASLEPERAAPVVFAMRRGFAADVLSFMAPGEAEAILAVGNDTWPVGGAREARAELRAAMRAAQTSG